MAAVEFLWLREDVFFLGKGGGFGVGKTLHLSAQNIVPVPWPRLVEAPFSDGILIPAGKNGLQTRGGDPS